MTRAQYLKATPAQAAEWLLASGWRRYYFMGWAFEARGRIIHCNLEGAVDMQLRRDAQAKAKAKRLGAGS